MKECGMQMVSVVITTFQGVTRGFLSDAIESVLSQTCKDFELLIIDDGSTDNTRLLCGKYLYDGRVKYFYQDNTGISGARNLGIKRSLGEYVCFLDDDDTWLPEKLEKQISFFNRSQDKRVGLCYTALEIIDVMGKKTGRLQSHHSSGNVFVRMLSENLVDCTSSVMIPRFVFDHVGLFKEEMSHAEDYDLWLRIAGKYLLFSIDEPLVLYREHGNKLSADMEKMERGAMQVVFRMLEQARDIDKNGVWNKFYKNRASDRFWRGDYKVFRRYVSSAATYGSVGLKLKLRVLGSYVPLMVKACRGMRWLLCG